MTEEQVEEVTKGSEGFVNSETISPEVSVIVVTYNQDLDRIYKTLNSIIHQEDISFEIIVCDDGSTTRFENELKEYFSSSDFVNYTLIFHEHNEGTVSNYYSGLEKSRGKYTKLISPGDYFSDKKMLHKWVQHLKDNNTEWSFSDTCYYRVLNGEQQFFRTKAHPQVIRPYIENNKKKCMWNYLALGDIANGSAIIGNREKQLVFCHMIKENRIIYCEDNIYRLMMFYGIVGSYFPESAICYEYGPGISTSGNENWKQKILEDDNTLIQIMKKSDSKQQKRMLKAFIKNCSKGKIRKLFIKGKLSYWLMYHFVPRLTSLPESGTVINLDSAEG